MPCDIAVRAAVGLGSNLGDRNANLSIAIDQFGGAGGCSVTAVSSFIETEPVGVSSQPPFLNAVLIIETSAGPHELLALGREAEDLAGRVRDPRNRWGPRTLDVDILVYGDAILDTPDLVLPHPRALDRLFVLEPWAEIAPDMRVPGVGMTVADSLMRLRSGANTLAT